MEWIKAEYERPEPGHIIVVKRKAFTRFDRDRFAVCRSGRTLTALPFYPYDSSDRIPWDLIEKWAYIDP